MSSRKQTVDGLDDIDDEDGTLEEEIAQETDLTLVVETVEEAVMGSDQRPQGKVKDEKHHEGANEEEA